MNQYIKVALEAVREAEKVILDHYKTDIKFTEKPDMSPVTVADKKAEEIIRAIITKHFPDHGFIGEEFGDEKENAEFKWIIDPIDGTKNYIKGIPFFSTLIALVKDGETIMGLSHAPVLRETIYAVKGEGAYMNDKKIIVSDVKDISDAFIQHGGINYFSKNGKMTSLEKLALEAWRIRSMGDSYMYTLLAQGSCDAVIEAKIHYWDIAPFVLIIEEAGGITSDIDGNKIDQNSTSFLACNKYLHPKVLKYFSH